MAPKTKKPVKKVYDYSELTIGMRVQVESQGTWFAAEVVAVSTSKNRTRAPVKVSYKGYDGYDEWVNGDRLRSKALKVEQVSGKNVEDASGDNKCYARLVFSRHGESEWNVANKFTGWVDVDLSEKGVGEAKKCR